MEVSLRGDRVMVPKQTMQRASVFTRPALLSTCGMVKANLGSRFGGLASAGRSAIRSEIGELMVLEDLLEEIRSTSLLNHRTANSCRRSLRLATQASPRRQ